MKALGIYDQDYHEKYNHYIEMRWLKEYLNAVKLDMLAGLYELNRKLKDAALLRKRFPEPEYKIFDINGNRID